MPDQPIRPGQVWESRDGSALTVSGLFGSVVVVRNRFGSLPLRADSLRTRYRLVSDPEEKP